MSASSTAQPENQTQPSNPILSGIGETIKSYRALKSVNPEQCPDLLMQHLHKVFEGNSDWENGGQTVVKIHVAYENWMKLYQNQWIDCVPQLLLETVEAILCRDKSTGNSGNSGEDEPALVQNSDSASDLNSEAEFSNGARKETEERAGVGVGVETPEENPSTPANFNFNSSRHHVSKCPICSMEFEEKDEWRSHIKDHLKTTGKDEEGKEPSSSKVDTEMETNDSAIGDAKHQKKKVTNNSFSSSSGSRTKKPVHKCPVCGVLSYCFEKLKRHVFTHVSSGVLCSICNQYFVDQDRFEEHVENVHISEIQEKEGNEEEEAEENLNVIQNQSLAATTKVDQGPTPTPAQVAGDEEEVEDEEMEMPVLEPMVDVDPQNHHDDEEENESQNGGESSGFDSASDSDSEWEPRMRENFDKEPDFVPPQRATPRPGKKYACPHCPKRWSHPYQLAMHLRVHTGERPFPCPICQKRFTQKGTVKGHLKTHEPRTKSKSK